ncbi:MAG TPA: ComF family protein [Vicinamibacterales bacterium]|nr:ComF family protein [Vicinamibacterales bacterium]
MRSTDALWNGLDAVLTVALGASCAACGELLEHPSRGPVCDICWRSVDAAVPCAFGISSAVDDAQAIGLYDGALRSIVHSLKYEGRRSLATPLGARMRERCRTVLDDAEVAVPVPLHASRRRERGFNQAFDLARELGLPVTRALRRVRATRTQTELSVAERHENVTAAFAPSRLSFRRRHVSGRVVVLVDDVSTTGATLHACAIVLKEIGAREVRAVTAAKVATPPR